MKNDMTIQEIVDEYEFMCDGISDVFIEKYFGTKEVESWWVADEPGGVLFVNNYFFNMSDIVDYLRYDYSTKKMFEYYEYSMDIQSEGGVPINIKHYKKLKKTNENRKTKK